MTMGIRVVGTGSIVRKHRLSTTTDGEVQIPDAKRLVHLQFRRFAGCPFCSVHLQSFVKRHDEIMAEGILEVAVFRSTTTALQHHHGNVPFAVIADPTDELYAEFGVGSGWSTLLHPGALLAMVPNVIRMLPKLPAIPTRGRGVLGLPADFLLATNGQVIACKYGTHAQDGWSVDELLSLARQHASYSSRQLRMNA